MSRSEQLKREIDLILFEAKDIYEAVAVYQEHFIGRSPKGLEQEEIEALVKLRGHEAFSAYQAQMKVFDSQIREIMDRVMKSSKQPLS